MTPPKSTNALWNHTLSKATQAKDADGFDISGPAGRPAKYLADYTPVPIGKGYWYQQDQVSEPLSFEKTHDIF